MPKSRKSSQDPRSSKASVDGGADDDLTSGEDPTEFSLDDGSVEDELEQDEDDSPSEIKPKKSKVTARRFTSDTDAERDATRLYLTEIGLSPLLTAEEEV